MEIRTNQYYLQEILHSCIDCGKTRWVRITDGSPRNLRCQSCAGKARPHKHTTINVGYVLVWIQPEHPLFRLARKPEKLGLGSYVRNNRLVYGNALCAFGFTPDEVVDILKNMFVHHKDGNKLNDELSNLELKQPGTHRSLHMTKVWEVYKNISHVERWQ